MFFAFAVSPFVTTVFAGNAVSAADEPQLSRANQITGSRAVSDDRMARQTSGWGRPASRPSILETSGECGDGIKQPDEECDDGNVANCDGCSSFCEIEFCGDSIVQCNEQCDDGPDNSDTTPDACRTSCENPRCGDGVTDPGNGEECDDGNTVAGDCCSPQCLREPAGSDCSDDGNPCTTDLCNETGECIHDAGNAGTLCRAERKGPECSPRSVPAGTISIPVAISSAWFQFHACGPDSKIRLYPVGSIDSCAGWHTFTVYPSSAARLGTILTGLKAGTYVSPETEADRTFYNFANGSIDTEFNNIWSLYKAKADANGIWSTAVAVYDSPGSCQSPSGAVKVLGFATVRIYSASPQNFFLDAYVDCGFVTNGEPRGRDFGTRIAECADCDMPEYCDGFTENCPADEKASMGTPCIVDGSLCSSDVCDGLGNCVSAIAEAGTPCRVTTGICDAVETCNGSSGICPNDRCCDANGDDEVTIADALLALRASAGTANCVLARCDFNGDGRVTILDALAILRAAIGIPGTPNCPPGL
ncbi:MAG TPA: DUF4215 domain-containing protein [Candidatus Binatia bacterium]|jgi:cysteine-rich repeat protein